MIGSIYTIFSLVLYFLQKYVGHFIVHWVSMLLRNSALVAWREFRATISFKDRNKKKAIQTWLDKHGRKSGTSGPTSFLHLPGELRNQVYDYYLAYNEHHRASNFWHNDYSVEVLKDVLAIANTSKEVREEILSRYAHRLQDFATSVANFVKFMEMHEAHRSLLLDALIKAEKAVVVDCERTWTHDMDILPTLMALRKLPKLKIIWESPRFSSQDLNSVNEFIDVVRTSPAWSAVNLEALKVSQVVLCRSTCWYCLSSDGSHNQGWALWHPRIVIEAFIGSEEETWDQGQEQQVAKLLKKLELRVEEDDTHFRPDVKLADW